MTLSEIAKHVWSYSHTFTFGLSASWDASLFTKPWAKARTPPVTWSAYGHGRHWFSLKMKYADLIAVPRPPTLTRMRLRYRRNLTFEQRRFGENLLCEPDNNGNIVIYNGHEGNVSSR